MGNKPGNIEIYESKYLTSLMQAMLNSWSRHFSGRRLQSEYENKADNFSS